MLHLHDTATGTVRPFEQRTRGHVSMYVCGPTVYDLPHIGHGRYNLVFDILRRYLLFGGQGVQYVWNITDVDDNIIKRANEQGRSEPEVAHEFEERGWEAMVADPRPGSRCRSASMPGSGPIRSSTRSPAALALIGFSLPTFFTGLVFILVFSVNLHWLPFVYRTDIGGSGLRPVLGSTSGRRSCRSRCSGSFRERRGRGLCAPRCSTWSASTTSRRRAPRGCLSGSSSSSTSCATRWSR